MLIPCFSLLNLNLSFSFFVFDLVLNVIDSVNSFLNFFTARPKLGLGLGLGVRDHEVGQGSKVAPFSSSFFLGLNIILGHSDS